ncbi:hypothetical protein CAN33_004935 [Aspergillus niger]|uniref:RRM domain-containing protein n=1 Tax=Aspergillus niger TaxID=5061 RepID=A0A505IA61_ASPNG|nr:hypothetical protein CAN33_004935 [Aspergillus niger]
MSKTKSVTKKGSEKPVDKTLSKVKSAGVTKSSQSPKAKSKQIARESSESESDSDEEMASDSSSSSESEDEKPAKKTEKKGKKKPSKKRKAEEETSATPKKSKTEDPAPGASANLFVGNLSWNVDEAWLQSEFESFGELSGVRIMTERDTGRSRGFGYVEYTNAVDAAKAFEAKKGAEIDGRVINLDYATGRPANKDQQGGFKDRANARARSFGDQASPESDTLFVGNLPFDANEDSVGELFGEKGSILGIRLPTDPDSGRPKGFGYVQYSSVDEARAAFNELQGADLLGRPARGGIPEYKGTKVTF